MNMITVHESKSTLDDIDKLVRQGQFSSRAEVYRMGALLIALRPEVGKLAKKAQLDTMIFRNHIKNCLDAIENGKLDEIKNVLHFVIDGMIFRELLSSVLSEENERVGFETIREGLTMYQDALSRISEMDENDKKNFFSGLKRDLSALKLYVEQTGETKNALFQSDFTKNTQQIYLCIPSSGGAGYLPEAAMNSGMPQHANRWIAANSGAGDSMFGSAEHAGDFTYVPGIGSIGMHTHAKRRTHHRVMGTA